MAMDVIDYQICGNELPCGEVGFDPDAAAGGECGAMMCMRDGIDIDTALGVGPDAQDGLMDKLPGGDE